MKKYILLVLLAVAIHSSAQVNFGTPADIPEHTQTLSSDSVVLQFLEQSGIPVTYNNTVTLLNGGEEKFTDLFAKIRQARHHIHLEYFNFRNDSIAKELFKLLAAKDKEGVEVRVLFDAFGNRSNNRPLKNKHLKAIRKRGIEIVKFDPLRFPYIKDILYRDHRKIVVIDGQTGYTGGINVADYYIQGLPGIGSWRDMHVRIEGGAVKYLQENFLAVWNKETKQNIGGKEYFPEPEISPGKTVAIIDRTPHTLPKLLRNTFSHSIRSAQKSIQIVNPYFVPIHSIKKALKEAIDRGVKVEIMIPAQSDVPFTPDASFHVVHKLMKRGAYIYLYDEGFHHAKVMMIDGKFCTVGSANLNSRSLRYDYETNAFIFDRETTNELVDLFEADKAQSTLLTPENWKERPKRKRLIGWFASLFTPVL